MKIWVTTYALTEGIKEYDARPVDISTGVMGYAQNRYVHGEGKNWHRTYEAARDRAEWMRVAKIESLLKQVDKLQALKFE